MKDSFRAPTDRVPRTRRSYRRELKLSHRRTVWIGIVSGLLLAGVVLVGVLCAGGTNAPSSADPPASQASAPPIGTARPEERSEVPAPLRTSTPTPTQPAAEESPPTPVASSRSPSAAPAFLAVAERELPQLAPAGPNLTAQPAAALPEPPAPAQALSRPRRIHDVSEEDLRKQLSEAPEIGLGLSAGRVLKAHIGALQRDMSFENKTNLLDATPLLRVLPDLRSLPYRHGPACQLTPAAARTLGTLAPKLHAYIDLAAPPGRDGRRADPKQLHDAMRTEVRGKRPVWLRAEAIPTMMQLLMHEDTPLRLMLVELLGQIDDPRATVALARRAVFDLSADARRAAVEALKKRRLPDARPVFLQALRYPWAPAAEHAAEALAALGDRGSVPHLVSLLGQPDPTIPIALDKTRTAVRELVRADHLNNCLMCHAPSLNGKEPVLGADPNLTIPVKRGQSGGGGGRWGRQAPPGRAPLLIRADITYLRQDFSVQLAKPILGGAVQQNRRFDFVVRTRLLPRKTADQLRKEAGDRPSYAQRDAVLFALRELTGKDAGQRTEAWQEMYPRAAVEVAAERLSGELLQASAVRRDQLLAKLRDEEGTGYAEALASAIPRLKGEFQEKVRDALARRLSRLPDEKLRPRLKDEDAEIRLAAGRACLEKGAHAPGEAAVREAAEHVQRKRRAELDQLEKKAATHLAYVKKLLREGKDTSVKERLDTIVRDFPNTPSAEEARRLRSQLSGK